MKLVGYGLQGGEPWAKVEFSLDELERMVQFLRTAPNVGSVGDLRLQLYEALQKLRGVMPPPPPSPPSRPPIPVPLPGSERDLGEPERRGGRRRGGSRRR